MKGGVEVEEKKGRQGRGHILCEAYDIVSCTSETHSK